MGKPLSEPLSEDIPFEIKDLVAAIASMPAVRDKLQEPLTKTIATLQKKRQVLDLVHEGLAQLRLDIKYLLFDLESTRLERDDYKQQLEK